MREFSEMIPLISLLPGHRMSQTMGSSWFAIMASVAMSPIAFGKRKNLADLILFFSELENLKSHRTWVRLIQVVCLTYSKFQVQMQILDFNEGEEVIKKKEART